MKIYAISDLHLSKVAQKPMDIFGDNWADHFAAIAADWTARVGEEDVVVVAGDLSWGMNYAEAAPDLADICALPGKKVLIRGNHDYWHGSLSKTRAHLHNETYFLQNDAASLGNFAFAGTRGWRQRNADFDAHDEKVFSRELLRLELSLKAAQKTGKPIIGITHYPPYSAQRGTSEFTELFSQYGVAHVVYGHLHGGHIDPALRTVQVGETMYYLTSCDFLEFKLAQII